MKIVYPVCCGIDVHKSFLVATIVSVTDLRTLKHKKERFSTFNKNLKRFKHWLIENNCYDAIARMILTAIYSYVLHRRSVQSHRSTSN